MAAVEHERIDVAPDFGEVGDVAHAAVEVGRGGNGKVACGPCGLRSAWSRARAGSAAALLRWRRSVNVCAASAASRSAGSIKLVHQAEPGHGVLGVADGVAVGGRDARARELSESAAPPTSSGHRDIRRSLRSVAVITICWALLTSRPERPMASGWCSRQAWIRSSGGTLMPRLMTSIAVVGEDDLDQVLADVVHVAFDGGEDDLAARGGVGLLHELLEVVDGGLHGFGGLQHLGDDQLVVVEQAADFGHAGHQRAVDDVERRRAFGAFQVEVGDEAVLGAFDDVVGQALVEREVFGAACLTRSPALRKCSVMAAMWYWLMAALLLAASARASPRARCAGSSSRRLAAC